MFRKKGNANSLEPPPMAATPGAVEILRVWAREGHPQQLSLQPLWNDPGAWGLLLADIARHVSRAYADQGRDPEEVLGRILELWNAEWANPTDEPEKI
jgi:hypothetical protein